MRSCLEASFSDVGNLDSPLCVLTKALDIFNLTFMQVSLSEVSITMKHPAIRGCQLPFQPAHTQISMMRIESYYPVIYQNENSLGTCCRLDLRSQRNRGLKCKYLHCIGSSFQQRPCSTTSTNMSQFL